MEAGGNLLRSDSERLSRSTLWSWPRAFFDATRLFGNWPRRT